MLGTCFCTTILDWTFFGLRTFDTILILNFFFLYITPIITVSTSFGGYSIDQHCKSIDWFLCDLDALIKMYSSYLTYVLCILFIYSFALCYLGFCLLILLILLFVVVEAVFAYSFLNSFHGSCIGSSMYFIFLQVISTLLFMLSLFIRTILFIFYHYSVFISVLVQFVDSQCFQFKLFSLLSL